MGFVKRTELVRRYAEMSGRSVECVNFYYALALFRITVIAAQIYIRFVGGQTQDQRFAMLGQLIPIVARLAEDVTTGKLNVAV